MEKKNQHIYALIAFFWFFIIVLGYFVIHKPFTPDQIIILFSHFWKFFLVAWLFCVAGGLGKSIFSLVKLNIGKQIYLEVAFGLGSLSIFVLILGAVWKINSTISFAILLLLSLLLFKFIKLWIKEFYYTLKDITLRSKLSKILFGLLAIILVTQLAFSLAPPTKYDALNYHLTLPKAYLLQEKITDIPWLVMSGMPQISEMLYTLLLSLGGASAALLFNWGIGILLIIGLRVFLEDHIDEESSWIAVVSLFAGYTFASSLSWGYVDLLAAFFGLAVVIFLVRFLQNNDNKVLFFVGIFCGFAFGCKYPAGVIFLSVFFSLIIIFSKSKSENFLGKIGLFSLGAGVSASPWLIKNLILTGNPVYPFFFEAGSMNQVRLDVYQGLSPYGNLLDLFFLPIRATIIGVDSAHGYSVSIGPLLLGLSLLAFIDWKNKSENQKFLISSLGLVASFGLLVWAIGNQFSGYLIQTRFYFVLFPTFAILAGCGYFQIRHYFIGRISIKRLIDSLVILVLALNSFQIFSEMIEKNVLKNTLGFMSNQEFLESNLGWYARAISDIDQFEDSQKVLMLYEPRGFGCIPKCDPDEILDHWKTIYHQINTNEKIISVWMNDGYTHLLVYSKGMEFLRDDKDPHHPPQELDALEKLLLSVDLIENYGDWYKLYVLDPN